MSDCADCGKPKEVPSAVFNDWWMAKRSEPFVPLRQFLAPYCTCEVPVE